MTENSFIVTTCGLSIVTNYLKEFGIYAGEVYEHSNEKKDKIDKDFLTKITPHLDRLKKEIVDYDDEKLKKISAELNAIVKFYKGQFRDRDSHLLLCTDTYLGRVSGEIIETLLRDRGLCVEMCSKSDLNTKSISEFNLALTDVAQDLSDRCMKYKDAQYAVVFNLTGGFKGVNSFLQTMASLYADRSIYIFEGSDELLEIPRLPIRVDEELFFKHTKLFRKLSLGLKVDLQEIDQIPQTLLFKVDNEFTLSAWGEILWNKIKPELYKKELLSPISQRLKYSNQLQKEFNKLSGEQKKQFNGNLDKLECCLEKGANLKSLNYHALKNSTYSHEFYPFDGDNSNRVYCNEKDSSIVIEKFDSHL